jgi:hypothetical protein
MIDKPLNHDLQATPGDAGGFPFMITEPMKARLRQLGHDDAAIRVMTPEAAQRILGNGGDPNTGNGHDQTVDILKTIASYVAPSFATKDGKPLSLAAKEKWKPAENGLRLDLEQLTAHAAKQIVIAVYPIAKGESITRVGVLDFDDHEKKVEWPDMVDAAKRVYDQLEQHSVFAFPVRSRRGRGIHLWVLLSGPVPAVQLRAFLRSVLADCGLTEGRTGIVKGTVEIFPKQDSLAAGSIGARVGEEVGNHITLPFAGDSVPLDPETFEITEHPVLNAINGPGPITAFQMDDQPATDQGQRSAPLAFDEVKLRDALKHVSPDDDKNYDQRRAFGLGSEIFNNATTTASATLNVAMYQQTQGVNP